MTKFPSTSSASGMESAAPCLCTLIAEAFAARSIQTGIGIPDMIEAKKYPVNVSPAAVIHLTYVIQIQ